MSTSGLRGSMTTSVTPVCSEIFEHLRPGLAAVGGLVEAAVAARRPQRALRGDVDRVAVLRVDDDAADVLGALEADVRPRPAAVLALVDAVAVADDRWELRSPVPTQTTLGCFGSSVTQPMENDPCVSNTGCQVAPPLTVFQTPPDAAPT